jgi:hypothetical protein
VLWDFEARLKRRERGIDRRKREGERERGRRKGRKRERERERALF